MSVIQTYKLDQVANNYSRYSLEWELKRATEDLKYLEKYVDEVKNQIAIIEKIKFKPVVVFIRNHNSFSGKVEYFVRLEQRPQIEGISDAKFRDSLSFPTGHHMRFVSGAQKKEARKYAEELAERYGAEIEMVGF